MIFTFEVTNLDSIQIFRFSAAIKQKAQLPLVGELQKRALIYLFERRLVSSVSEMSVKVNPAGNLITLQITGGENERYFVKIREFK